MTPLAIGRGRRICKRIVGDETIGLVSSRREKRGYKMDYIKVASSADLSPGQMKEVTAGAKKLLLANLEGNFYAVAKKCPHLGGNLCKGKLEGAAVKCPLHGAKFDLKTGKALRDAQLLFLKMKVKDVQTFPVKLDGGNVLVGV